MSIIKYFSKLSKFGLLLMSINGYYTWIFVRSILSHTVPTSGDGWTILFPLLWNFPSCLLMIVADWISDGHRAGVMVLLIAGCIQWYLLGWVVARSFEARHRSVRALKS